MPDIRILFALAATAVCMAGAAGAAGASAQSADRKPLTIDGTRRIIAAAGREAEAAQGNVATAAVADVDDGGNVIAVERPDHTFAGAPHPRA